MAQSPLNDTTQPVDSEEEGRSSTMDRQWLIEKKAAFEHMRFSPLLWIGDLRFKSHMVSPRYFVVELCWKLWKELTLTVEIHRVINDLKLSPVSNELSLYHRLWDRAWARKPGSQEAKYNTPETPTNQLETRLNQLVTWPLGISTPQPNWSFFSLRPQYIVHLHCKPLKINKVWVPSTICIILTEL